MQAVNTVSPRTKTNWIIWTIWKGNRMTLIYSLVSVTKMRRKWCTISWGSDQPIWTISKCLPPELWDQGVSPNRRVDLQAAAEGWTKTLTKMGLSTSNTMIVPMQDLIAVVTISEMIWRMTPRNSVLKTSYTGLTIREPDFHVWVPKEHFLIMKVNT